MKVGDIIAIEAEPFVICNSIDEDSCKGCFFLNPGNICYIYRKRQHCAAIIGSNLLFKKVEKTENIHDYPITADEARRIPPPPMPDINPALKNINKEIKLSASQGDKKSYFFNDILRIQDLRERIICVLTSKGYKVVYIDKYNIIQISWE